MKLAGGRKVVVRSDEQRGLHAVRNRKRRRVREFWYEKEEKWITQARGGAEGPRVASLETCARALRSCPRVSQPLSQCSAAPHQRRWPRKKPRPTRPRRRRPNQSWWKRRRQPMRSPPIRGPSRSRTTATRESIHAQLLPRGGIEHPARPAAQVGVDGDARRQATLGDDRRAPSRCRAGRTSRGTSRTPSTRRRR